jgi:hypothetical protein
MVLQVSTANEVAIYSITSAGTPYTTVMVTVILGKSAIPDWLASQKKKSLKHDDGNELLPLIPFIKKT